MTESGTPTTLKRQQACVGTPTPLRWTGNPSIQFLIVLVVAPVAAIAGASVGSGSSWEAAGWLMTCSAWAGFGFRSLRHERRRQPSGSGWASTLRGGALARYMIGVMTLVIITTGAAVVFLWLLISRLMGWS